jgi:group I intron endonuclease
MREYFNILHLETQIKTNKSFIYRSLLKYGYSNFRLEILEYCDPDKTLNREQAFLDLLQPHYNILKKAGSLLGFRHSEETIAKLKTQS